MPAKIVLFLAIADNLSKFYVIALIGEMISSANLVVVIQKLI